MKPVAATESDPALRRRLARDRYFGWALAGAAVTSAAALLVVVGFLFVGALPLLDLRGPALTRVDPPVREPEDSPSTLRSALDASQPFPLCAASGALQGCFAQRGAQLEFTLQRIDCGDCQPDPRDRAQLPLDPWRAVALLRDQRSLLIAGTDGSLRWIKPYRDAQGQLTLDGSSQWALSERPVVALQPMGTAGLVLAIDEQGGLVLLDPSQQRSYSLPEPQIDLAHDRLRLDGSALLLEREGELQHYRFVRLDAPSLIALWRPLQVSGREGAESLWQPHSDDGDGTPRLNLIPLLLGSLKAALLGLLFGAPLAIGAAMHSVQYRSGVWQAGLKSSFEMMEAVPTVILGLVAGLWVAPWLDQNLGLALGAALGWLSVFALPGSDAHIEQGDRRRGSQSLLHCAGGLLIGGLIGSGLEQRLPGGRLTVWIEQTLGWHYEPYNGLVVGLLVGLAIAPMIYSLSEEALRRVPAGLQEAALALGGNRRDILFGLLLPAALPGIIAAVLLGFGRALGETLIVLLASNNAPIADLNPLSGLRSVTATLVLEAPTSVPGSVHYQVLLLATLLIMATTIGLNLLANRWRKRQTRRPPRLRMERPR